MSEIDKLRNNVFNNLQYIEKLEQENKQLKERIKKVEDYASKVGNRRNELYDKIDKAIEYIKKEEHSKWIMYGRNVLLEILGDKE